MLADNLKEVQENIRKACEKSHRNPNEVTLIAVSKTKPVETLQEAYDAGARFFGENKVQEITAKYPELPKDIHWHMIGHLQTNKVKYIIDKVCMIHSVESLHLAKEINKRAEQHGITMDILIEVNTAQDENKFGVAPEDTEALIRQILGECPSIRIRGLMTIAPYRENPEDVRPFFRRTKELYDEMAKIESPNLDFKYLSMGMSNDRVIAEEEGSTIIRVGSAIFGARDYSRK